MMASYTIRSWTVCGLIGAFIDLALAYFLLCVSTFAFFPSKFCNLFGFFLPCPCTGFFGYQNNYVCWHKLLFDLPRRKIVTVHMLIKSRFPFDLIWFHDHPCNLDMAPCSIRTYDHGFRELENEGSSSAFSSPKLQNLVDRESGFDAKGKKVVNQKQRYGTRRRRRSALGFGKSPSSQSVIAGASCSTYNGSDIKSQIIGKQDGLQDEGQAVNGLDLGGTTWDNFEQSGLVGKNKAKRNDSSSVEKFIFGKHNAHDNSGHAGNEENVVRTLEEALREEIAACSALQLELEKERAASATAADEAMAMILRLQAEKAAVEMEARQYQRMIEEQVAYEEEEMDILKEILVKRERENHFLEKEVEAYRQMKCLRNVQSEVDMSYMTSELGQKPSHSPDPKEESSSVLRENGESKSIGNNADWLPTYKVSFAEVTSEALQTCSGIEEIRSCCGDNIEKDKEHKSEVCDSLNGSILDSEPIIYDVHVVDDKTELRKEDNSKESGPSNFAVNDFGVSMSELVGDCSSTSIAQRSQNNHSNIFEMKNGVPELGHLRNKNLHPESARSSSSIASGERLKTEMEVELFRERLRRVQEGKEKLSFSPEQRESVNAHLKLVEDMLNQLREIQELREPVRQASLPPSSKVNMTKRRAKSMSLESHESL